MPRNKKGKKVSAKDLRLENDAFGEHARNVFWDKFTEYADKNGFDKRYEIQPYILKPGTKIIRYGSLKGFNSTVPGTPYDAVSLPYIEDTVEYHEFKVIKTLEVGIVVQKGVVAPAFNRVGLGMQFLHSISFGDEIAQGNLKEEKLWLIKEVLFNILHFLKLK